MTLPRGYLSYSALDTWCTSKDLFRRRYYENKDKFSGNIYTDFGSKIHDQIENGHIDVPHGTHHEIEIRPTVLGVPLLCRIDSLGLPEGKVYEFKTGAQPWTQERVDKHKQLDLYALAVREHYGEYHPTTSLTWLETQRVSQAVTLPNGFTVHQDQVELTGNVHTFERTIDPDTLDMFAKWLRDTAEEIEKDYVTWRFSHPVDN